MQGSLDNPPVIVRQDRWKFLLMLIFALAMAITPILGFVHGSRTTGTIIAFVASQIFGCLITSFCACGFALPGSYTLEPAGLTVQWTFKRRQYKWSDFERFWIGGRWPIRWVSCTFSQSYTTAHGGPLMLGFPLTAMLPSQVELDDYPMRDLLNEAAARWKNRR